MKNKEKIKEFLNNHNGYISTSDFIALGINKALIPTYIKEGIIRKVAFGLFIDNNLIEDEFYILQRKYPSVIYSHFTALNLLKLTTYMPTELDVTVKRKDKVRGNYNVHYITDKYHELGAITINSPYGAPIKVYNAERSICDMLRNKDKKDSELEKKIIKNYFNSKEKDTKLLIEYAKIFNIYDKIVNNKTST